MSIKKDILWRVVAIYLLIAALGIWITIKIFYLQVFEKEKWIEKQKNTTLKDFTIPADRGDILTSDGRILASSVPYYEVRMDMKTGHISDKVFYAQIDSLAWCLSNLFHDKSAGEYKQELIRARKKNKRFHLLQSHVNYIELKALKSFPMLRKGRYIGGLIYIQENLRVKPHQSLASRTIGYTYKDERANIVGIEGAYDHYLGGVKGIRLMQKLSGNVWMPINDGNEIEPRDGYDVITTIDINLQDVAHDALLNQLVLQDAHHGTVVVMEVQTGEIKAITNLTKDDEGRYREIYNYAIGESTEPGSTFKLPILMAALEDGTIDLDDTVDTEKGIVYFYDKGIKDSNHGLGGYGKITVKQVFEYSSNVGMAKIVTQLYSDRPHHLIDRLYSMNINERLGIEIKGEGQPLIKYPGDKYWSGISLPMMAHGYEVQCTPLQILAFYNAVANNGKLVKPKFVKEIREHGRVVKEYNTEVIKPSICSKSTIKKAKIILEGVVENGTAKNLKIAHLKIAGKTGTTQIANKKYGYKTEEEISYQASFVGYFPADNPKYSCIVVVNSPSRKVYYGNQVAGPVFLEIANKVYATNLDLHGQIRAKKSPDLPYSKNGNKNELTMALENLDIKLQDKAKNSDWVVTQKQTADIEFNTRMVIENLVPNVVAMGAKDAVYLLEKAGLQVKIVGRGSVQSQSIPAGTRAIKGSEIILEMSFI